MSVITDLGASSSNGVIANYVSISATAPIGTLVCILGAEMGGNGIQTDTSVTDGVGNTYTKALSVACNNSVANGFVQLWYSVLTTALSTSPIYFNASTTAGGADSCGIAGLSATQMLGSPYDSAVQATAYGITNGSGTGVSVTSGTPSVYSELFVSGICINAYSGGFTQDTGNGWATPFSSAGIAPIIAGGRLINNGVGTKTFAPSGLPHSSYYAAFIVGFKTKPLIGYRRLDTRLRR